MNHARSDAKTPQNFEILNIPVKFIHAVDKHIDQLLQIGL